VLTQEALHPLITAAEIFRNISGRTINVSLCSSAPCLADVLPYM
jgi:hypothetical protein